MTQAQKIENGPALWNQLLELVRQIDPIAVIAGGAPRDFILGIEPKDIDVFVNVDRSVLEKWFHASADYQGLEVGLLGPTMADMNYALDTDWSPDSMAALDGRWYPAKDTDAHVMFQVQIIAHPIADFADLNTYADAIMRRMDIGLCQAVWKGGAEWADIMTTEAFAYDMANFRLSIIRQQSAAGLKASINRVERIMSRLNSLTISGYRWRDA